MIKKQKFRPINIQSFRDYLNEEQLTEGGNVIINDVPAQRINLQKIKREDIVPQIYELLMTLNKDFAKSYGLPLWNKSLITSKKFLSGSAFHFFDTTIPDDEFRAVKPSVGDVDTQIDRAQAKNVAEFLNKISGKKFKGVTFVGFKNSVDTIICVFSFDNPAVNVQIDLEFVDFSNGKPTEWSLFAHSSDWNDLKSGIKGVFHKFLLRALTTKTIKDIILLSGKRKTPKKMRSTELAFSVVKGLRYKMEPKLDEYGNQEMQDGLPVFDELPTSKSTFYTDLKVIFTMLFGGNPTKQEITKFGSFIGGVELMNKYFSSDEKKAAVEGFVFTLWGPYAQLLYRGDPVSDNNEKSIAYNKMIEILGSGFRHPNVNKMRVDYYKSKA